MLYYITHPNVSIEPEVPVPQWSLSDEGQRRAMAMLDQPWVRSINRVISSPEQKAIETAQLLAEATDTAVEVREETGETDRSATGFVPHEVHENLANRFFAEPEVSANGWERAIDAQARIVSALRDLTRPGEESVAVVGHGAVGTLLMAHLAGLSIDRQHDQPGQGHYWAFDRTAQHLLHRWLAIDQR